MLTNLRNLGTQNGLFSCRWQPFPIATLRCQSNMSIELLLLGQTSFPRLAGANIKPFFIPHNTFCLFFEKNFQGLQKRPKTTYYKERFPKNGHPRFCGCKHTTLFPFRKNFLYFFFNIFLTQT